MQKQAEHISFEDTKFLQKELYADEQLLWSGKPDAKREMLFSFWVYIFAIPGAAMSLLLAVMTSAWLLGWNSKDQEFWMGVGLFIFGIPFIILSIAMIFYPYVAYHNAKKTIYAITNRRAIILMNGRNKGLESYPLIEMKDELKYKANHQGVGYLYFHFINKIYSDGDIYRQTSGFKHIAEACKVATKLKAAIQNAEKTI